MALSIKVKSKFCFSYSEHLNKVPFIDEITIKNNGKEDAEKFLFCLFSEPCFFKTYEVEIPALTAGGVYVISNLVLEYEAEMLAGYNEAIEGLLICQMVSDEKVIYKNEYKVDLRPYDEGSNYLNDAPMRAAFVTPNHPEIASLVTKISDKKGIEKGSYSIVGYQWGQEEILKTAECMFEVVKEQEIAYVLSKSGFHRGYQRIRLVDEILAKKQGNCMDMTYLFASLLEAMGIHPLLVLTQTHAFVGFWLVDKTHSQPVISEKDFLRKHTVSGSKDIVIFECTNATKGDSATFQQACEYSLQLINKNKDIIEYVVDVERARQGGIVPLPARVSGSQLHVVSDDETGNISKVFFEYPDLADEEEESAEVFQAPNKVERWKNKLLDLTASSALLNLKINATGKGAAYILSTDASALYKKAKSGQAFFLEGQPEDFEKTKRSADLFELASGVYSCKNIVEAGLQQNILHISYEESTTKKLLSAMRNADKNHREQNGAGILYMTFGSMRWTETKTGKQYYAPILLVPVVFEKVGKIFQLVYEGTEIFLNAAVLEMLKIRYDLRPVGLNPLPMESDGKPDLAAILKHLRKACQNQSGLEVFDHVCIGLFAFSQYLMWNDLDKYESFFLEHPIIKSIVDGEPLTDVNKIENSFTEEDVFLPIPADGSQIKAIQSALGNQSFVLHGPPGTGKSQTITVMLANYLAYNRNVLFSAEKAAALQVVYNRMKSIYLEDFCLYLPADSSKKSDVERFLAQYANLLQSAEDMGTNYEELRAKILEDKKNLEEQLKVFEVTSVTRQSLDFLISATLKHKNCATKNMVLTEDMLKRVQDGQYEELMRLLKKVLYMGELAGGVKNHPLRNWKNLRYEYGIQQKIRENSEEYLELLRNIAEIDEKLPQAVSEDVAKKYYGEHDLRARYRMISYANVIPEEYRQEKDFLKKLKAWSEYAEVSVERDKFYELIMPEFLDLDLDNYKYRWDYLRRQMSIEGKIGRMDMKKDMQKYICKQGFTDKDLSDIFEMAVKVRDINKKVPLFLDYSFDLTVQQAKELANKISAYYPNGIPAIVEECTEEHRKLAQQGIQLIQKHDALCKKLKVSIGSDIPFWNPKESLKDALHMVERWSDGLDTLREWLDYQVMREDAVAQGLTPWLVLYESGEECENVLQAFEVAVSQSVLHKMYEEHEEIRQFAGYRFDNLVLHYEELMKQYYTVCAKEIRHRALHRVVETLADPNHGADRIALKKLIEAAGKGHSIRSIMNRLGGFLLKMTPCVMATPMTTAMYFAPDCYIFDHMVLDEASQIQTCKSVGLIARCRQAIVVGDPNQMPPTAFFESSAMAEDVDFMEEDQESILKDFIALDMPDYYLKWHYRSHHESLISYSNQNYYGGRMITFPSQNNQNSRVRVIRTNGIYDRGNSTTNKIEAEALVNYLAEKLAEGDSRSYGIIAFNKRQQMLMERLIEKRCDTDEVFSTAVQALEDKGEAIFVRNLESVQGDERDVILFTIGFGPDAEGKIIMSFGPLAKAGGWRRLNVAITRARDEMILFTSMDSNQMTITETTSRGVRDLKNFIAYAEGKVIDTEEVVLENNAQVTASTEGFADCVCAYLDELGYKYSQNIGNSALKIDIAIEHPKKSGEYMLGILLNSKAIGRAFSVYDSEVGQSAVLKKQGWNLLRLWSLDWLEDVAREKKRIANACAGMSVTLGLNSYK